MGDNPDPDVDLRTYVSALRKNDVTPEDLQRWSKALPDDMPDDSNAFFK